MPSRVAKARIAIILILACLLTLGRASAAGELPIFYSTLDSAGTVSKLLTKPANDFVPGKVGKGLQLDAAGEYAFVRQISNGKQNIELTRGTIDFWYKPNYSPNDGLRHDIFRVGTNLKPGTISLVKRRGGHGNELWLNLRDKDNNAKNVFVAGNVWNWAPNTWVNLRITWDTTVAANELTAHLYLNGVELPQDAPQLRGPFPMPNESATENIYIGSGSTQTTGQVADGVIDEFKIFDRALSGLPAPTRTRTPTAAPTRTSTRKATAVPTRTSTRTATAVPTRTSTRTPTATLTNTVVPSPTAGAARPNIVMIYTDDQRVGSMSFFSILSSRLQNQSVRFENAFATNPTCCPSRSTLFTGQYSHHHGVLSNEPPTGSITKFNSTSTLPVWLSQAGYQTGIFGKYLNGYGCFDSMRPPGWTDWHVFDRCQRNQYFNYSLNNNGTSKNYPAGVANNYSTRVLAGQAAAFIRQVPTNQPLFLYFSPAGPHDPSIPDPLDTTALPGLVFNPGPSFNEEDVSDKPRWVQNLPQLTASEIALVNSRYLDMSRSLLSIDRAIGQLLDTLQATNRLDNTMIIFMSDNGLSLGEHRWFIADGDEYGAKECIYEECVKVDLWVRLPEKISRVETNLVGNIDLAPTILDVAGVAPPATVNGFPLDGRSLIPLIKDPSIPWRKEILLESLGHEPEVNFRAVRTARFKYGEYENGDKEMYDLVNDPFELTNLCPASSNFECPGKESRVSKLGKRLGKLK